MGEDAQEVATGDHQTTLGGHVPGLLSHPELEEIAGEDVAAENLEGGAGEAGQEEGGGQDEGVSGDEGGSVEAAEDGEGQADGEEEAETELEGEAEDAQSVDQARPRGGKEDEGALDGSENNGGESHEQGGKAVAEKRDGGKEAMTGETRHGEDEPEEENATGKGLHQKGGGGEEREVTAEERGREGGEENGEANVEKEEAARGIKGEDNEAIVSADGQGEDATPNPDEGSGRPPADPSEEGGAAASSKKVHGEVGIAPPDEPQLRPQTSADPRSTGGEGDLSMSQLEARPKTSFTLSPSPNKGKGGRPSALDKSKAKMQQAYGVRPKSTPAGGEGGHATDGRPATTAGGPRPKTGSSIKSLMVWRSQSGTSSTGKHSAEALAKRQAEWDAATRRSWTGRVPLSQYPNPPTVAFPQEERPSAKFTEPDRRTGASGVGIGWDQVKALRMTARLASPSACFSTAERTGGLTRAEARVAKYTPSPFSYNTAGVTERGQIRSRGGDMTVGLRTPVDVVYSAKFHGNVVAHARRTVIDESGIQYSSIGKQVLGVLKTQPRRGMARSTGPGPAHYDVVVNAGDPKDAAYRTKNTRSPAYTLPKNTRPWQKAAPNGTVPCTTASIAKIGMKQQLAHHRSAPTPHFGKADRMPKSETDSPGPGKYAA